MKKQQRLQQTFRYFQVESLNQSAFRQNSQVQSKLKMAPEESQLIKLQNMLTKKPTFQEMMLLQKQNKQLQNIIEIYKQQEDQTHKQTEQLLRKITILQKQKDKFRFKNKQLQIQINKFDEIRSNIVEQYQTLKTSFLQIDSFSSQKQIQCQKLRQKLQKYEKFAQFKDENLQLKSIQVRLNNQIHVLKNVILQLRSQIRDIKVQMFQKFVLQGKCRQFIVTSEQVQFHQKNKQNQDQNAGKSKHKILKPQSEIKVENSKQKKSRETFTKSGLKNSKYKQCTTISYK